MLEFERDRQFFIFNFDLPLENQSAFFDPQFWLKKGRITGSAHGRGVTYFLDTQDLFGMNSALRHYYRGGLWAKINRDRYCFHTLAQTRSFAEFSLLNQLAKAGLTVPKAIGTKITKGRFGCYQADILTQKIENAQDLTALLQNRELAEKDWWKIGRLIRRLHDLQVCHTDLNAHNILVQNRSNDWQYWLIDFDKCGYKSGSFWKKENLMRLRRSFNKETERMRIQFRPENWQQLLAGYHD